MALAGGRLSQDPEAQFFLKTWTGFLMNRCIEIKLSSVDDNGNIKVDEWYLAPIGRYPPADIKNVKGIMKRKNRHLVAEMDVQGQTGWAKVILSREGDGLLGKMVAGTAKGLSQEIHFKQNKGASVQLNPLSVSPPLPTNMKIIPPNANLPLEISKFSGIWEGTWCFRPHGGAARDTRRAILVVEEIISPESVRVIYSWGPTSSGGSVGFGRFHGRIAKENNEYYLTFETKKGPFIFTMKRDKLISWVGLYQSKSDIEMTRRP